MDELSEIGRRASEVGIRIPDQYPTHADVGREWLWWHVEKRRWRRVELLEVAEGKPKRVKVQHLDPDMAARAAWSPIGRCRIPWDQRDVYIESVDSWSRAVGHPFDDDERDAAIEVFLAVVTEEIAFLGYKPGGTLELKDPQRLSAMAGIAVAELLGHPDTYRDADGWLIPWPVTKRVAMSLAQQDPLRFVRAIAHEEQQTRPEIEALIEGEIAGGRDELKWMTDEEKEEVVRKSFERTAGRRAILLSWVGGTRPSLGQEYRRLQGRYRELARLAADAVPELRSRRTQTSAALADRIESVVTAGQRLPDVSDV
ncbi:hypothetical protein [Microbacterium imperiale]|uniref:Uncharacterized protein n=1 Tax=Microbacterium imperiale TaxID=33884 RepID=A0A9W6HH82_9MICO|nr:hypothetical protein [Microbacterium imperiale]MBP2422059.1 hypothetical protein [Microbacterium imperiale]MDS0200216.1 hypothetical protein [Microbacterium imperiale]BFE39366.1 hypothetical protein GCM10017544_03220 [Microbacterium imperiale]GLJ79767.1 hypothetical protein GCM10017586_14490 [Microbacterium imperiale]